MRVRFPPCPLFTPPQNNMINRHLVKNIIYIISIGILTLIITVILLNSCAKWNQEDALNYFYNPGNFYELEMCNESLNIVTTSLTIQTIILAIIGIFQIFYAVFVYQKRPNLQKDGSQLIKAGRFLLVASISIFIIAKIMSNAF